MFRAYLELGFEHILDPQGLDHVLFIFVLAVPFLLRDWRKVVILATAFTVGHSLTLALSAFKWVNVNSNLIEILIAISILITAVYNIIDLNSNKTKIKYPTAAAFGLIHGLGFSNFFKTILGDDNITLPLFAFNVGVELAQLVIVLLVLLVGYVLVQVIKIKHSYWISATSIFVAIWAFKMVLERV